MTLGLDMAADAGAGGPVGPGIPGERASEELPSGWTRATLGELGVEAQPGFASGKHNRDGDGIIHLRPMNVTRNGVIDLSDARYVEDESDRRVGYGDVLFNNTNSPALVGKTAWVNSAEPVAYSNHMTRLRGPQGLDSKFLAIQIHWIWATGYFKTILNNHVNQASVAMKALLETQIVIPPLPEQRRIAAEVERQIAHIEAGEAAVRTAVEHTSDLRSSIADTAISQLCEHPLVKLQEVLREPLRNGVSAKATNGESGIRTLTLTAVTRNNFSDQFTKVTSANPEKVKNLWLEDRDIFVQRSNSAELVGTSALYQGPSNWAIYPDLLIRVRVQNNRVLPEYAALVLRTNKTLFYFRQNARGLSGSMPKIDQSLIANVEFPLPPLQEQREVVTRVKQQEVAMAPILSSITMAQENSLKLRSSLLHAAFTGALVSQDTTDEPASILLDRIRAQQGTAAAKMPRKRTARKPRPSPPGQEELSS
ncbi:restriction endonuclease subunit S [[Kitasatospora] papulosa]|uniref:restriction endonuclease subunit S n=1 Tax=[Kitasatospora] papulosa TaxID=1464011 RepID=UPI0036912D7C